MDAPDAGHHLTNQITSTGDTFELLNLMASKHHKEVEPQHVATALSRLFMLKKSDNRDIDSGKILHHQGFSNILHMIKFKSSQMEVNDLLTTLKVLSFFGLKSESIMSKRMLNLIKDKINELTPNQLIFLNFLLKKQDSTPLIEALKIAIPIVFEVNLSQNMDHDNPVELAEVLHFASISSMKVTKKSLTSIFTALTIHGKNLSVEVAKSVVWSLSALKALDETSVRLLSNCIKILSTNCRDLSFHDIETTLDFMIESVARGYREFYSEEFFNNAARIAIENNEEFIKASYIQKKFNKISFVSYELLDYIDTQVLLNPSNLSSCKIPGIITFASGFSNANYKSQHWDIIKPFLLENPSIGENRLGIPWMKVAVDFMALGIFSEVLLEKVFSTDFLTAYIGRSENKLDQLQFLLVWQSVKVFYPEYNGTMPDQRFINDATLINLAKSNEAAATTIGEAVGGRQFVQTNVASSLGHCLDCVVSFDANENPIEMPCKINNYSDLPKSQVESVAVFLHGRGNHPFNYPQKLRGMFDLRRKTIEALGIRTVDIMTTTLHNLDENERSAFIEREIRHSLRFKN